MTVSFERTLDRLDQQIGDGLFTRGAQMTVEIGGARLLDVALGDNGTGDEMTPEHIFRVYCTIKPVTTLAIARLVDDGTIGLDEPLASHLPDLVALRDGTSLRHVLTHTAGLHRPMAVEMELVTAAKRRARIAPTTLPAGWRPRIDAAYSEYFGWHVLGWLIEEITGQPLREHLREVVIEPLELWSTWIGMTDAEYLQVLARIGVNADMRNLGGFPMLFERGRRVCTEVNPAHGGYTNARDLARFYSAVLAGLAGHGADALASAETLRTFCSVARPRVFDAVLDRECSFGLGFMTDLSEHAFGDRCSRTSFGHSGNVGASFAFADPERDLAVGVVFNGLVGHETAFLRRKALINALYNDLDAAEAADEPAAPDPRPKRGRFRRSDR